MNQSTRKLWKVFFAAALLLGLLTGPAIAASPAQGGTGSSSDSGGGSVGTVPVIEAPTGGAPSWIGALYFSQDSNADGLHYINPLTGAGFHVGLSGASSSTVGLAPGPFRSILFGSQYLGLLVIPTDGSGSTQLGTTGMEGMAFNTYTGRLYGTINNSFFQVNYFDGSIMTPLLAPGFDVEGLAADPIRNLVYGIGNDNNLIVYDVRTSTWSTVGDTGKNWNDAGLAYNPDLNLLYAMSNGNGATLYEINPKTASVQSIGATGIAGIANGGLAFLPAPEIHYVAATWDTDAIYLLDEDLEGYVIYAPGSTDPDAITTDGWLIWSGYFSTQEVVAHDFHGSEQFRWSDPALTSIQGMDLVNGELAVMNGAAGDPLIRFYNPYTGAFLRSIPAQSEFVEGLAFDGTLLWQLGAELYGADPADGTIISTIPNAAAGCGFGGTGLTASAPGELTIACDNGTWYRVSSADGSILFVGNNGLIMMGLERVPQPPAYVAATWSDDAVHLLDRNLHDVASFPAGALDPNGITTDGSLIWSGHFSTQEVIAYDYHGVEQFRWSDPALDSLQGLELVNGELAVMSAVAGDPVIRFYDPYTGAFLRSIPAQNSSIEGLAFDGTLLWQVDDQLYGVNPADGSLVSTIPNPASVCSYAGTGLTYSGPGRLTAACPDGRWFHVATADGSVLDHGNNDLDMYGIESTHQPPAFVAATQGDNAVHLLDNKLHDLGSFPAGAINGNAITTNGTLIWTGHYGSQEVIAYDYNGTEQFRWGYTEGLFVRGMDLVNGELALVIDDVIHFYDPYTGAHLRSFAGQSGVEALAFDGTLLWQLGNDLFGTNPADGSVVSTILNPAVDCAYDGTGLTASWPGILTVACDDGRWFDVLSATGGGVSSGNNGLVMMGLERNPAILPNYLQAAGNSYITDEDVALTIGAPGVLGNDFDLWPLQAGVDVDPANGTLALASDGSFTYSPDPDYYGLDTFSYFATNGQYTDTAVVTVTINPVNDAPVAVDDEYSVIQDTTLTVAAPGVMDNDNDVDGDSLHVVGVTVDPTHGTMAMNADGSFIYVPDGGYIGDDSFEYNLSDSVLEDLAVVTIHVLSAAQPEINVTPATVSATLAPGGSTNQNLVIQNLGDADLTWSAAENPAAAWLSEANLGGTVVPGGSYTLVLTFNATGLAPGIYTITLEVTSNDLDEATVSVTVTLEVVEGYSTFLPVVTR